jgi:Flp pilus assembly protein TadD
MEEVLMLTDRLARDLLAGLNVKLEAKPAPTHIETVSDYRMAWLTGLGAFYTGQYPRAIAWLTRARRLEPQNPRIALLLARAYLAANEKEHAAVELRRLVRDFPNSAEAKEAEGLLKSSG